MLLVSILIEPEAEDLPLPSYSSEEAAGADLCAAVEAGAPVLLAPGERALISTGIRMHIPRGYEGQVRPRSGLAAKHGLGIVNSPGTVDSDYRGVVRVPLINWGTEPIAIHRGDRIAQIVIAPVARAEWRIAKSLEATGRADAGFGSTGIGSDASPAA